MPTTIMDMAAVLTDDQVERFITEGFIDLSEAFPRRLADECRASPQAIAA